jgi:hypothetical protein
MDRRAPRRPRSAGRGMRIAFATPMALARRPEHRTLLIAALLASPALTGCELIKGIFKAGVWTGVIGVVIVVALIVWGLSKLAKR